MRLIRLALPVLLFSAAGCAASTGATASASTSSTAAESGGVELLNRAEALRLMDRYYPQLLRDARVTGDVVVRLALDAQGGVAEREVLRSTQEQFSNAALTVAEELRFTPPAAAGTRVNVRMQFVLDGGARITVVR